eukprot:scaffold76913_cov22-Tisochrysis_lutea.AAC.1
MSTVPGICNVSSMLCPADFYTYVCQMQEYCKRQNPASSGTSLTQDPETERKLAAAEEKKRIQETRERVDPQVRTWSRWAVTPVGCDSCGP